jgi:succinoglycan biosynthesis transport protein ExoP
LFEDLQAEAKELGRQANEVNKLREEARAVERKLDEVKAALDNLRVESTGSGRIAVVSYGDRPLGSFKDQRKMFGAAGGAGGVGLGVGLILMLGLADRRLRSSADATFAAHRSSTNRLLGILPAVHEKNDDPERAAIAAHCVHHVRALMQLRRGGVEQRTFMITSPAAGDGKTSLTLALGMSFAISKSRTLVIDCDMVGGGLSSRTGRLLRQPEDEPAPGLLDVLRGEPLLGCAVASGFPNLDVLPLGAADTQHVAQLSPLAIRRLIEEAKASYDTILIDTGPILGSLEASMVAPVADGVVLTVSRGEQRPLAEQAVDFLISTGARVTGVVFNRARHTDLVSSSSVVSARSVASSKRAIVPQSPASHGRFRELGPLACAVAASSSLPLPASAN